MINNINKKICKDNEKSNISLYGLAFLFEKKGACLVK